MNDLEQERRALRGLAYRMLGSLADAEDVVQEALVRWHVQPNKGEVQNPKAYVTQVVVRLCIDRMKSAQARREVYVGPWLPDPVLDAESLGPSTDAASELASDLSVALLLTLERLSPLERAAFVLHDIFDAEWSEVASTLGRTEVACRQLASRARVRVREGGPRFRATPAERDRVVQAFSAAVATGELTTLTQLLAPDAVFLSDGGGHVKAALRPVLGQDRIARLILGLRAKSLAGGGSDYTPVVINGLPGFLIRSASAPFQTFALDIDDAGLIRAIYVVSNPEKLRHIAPS